MADKKLFGKFHDLILLLIGSFLSIGVGTYIANSYQKEEWNRQNEVAEQSTQTRRAEEIYKNLSKLMDYRLYQTRRLNWDEYSDSSKKNFDIMLVEWNSQLNSSLNLIEVYFGKEAKDFFLEKISDNFRSLYKEMASANYDDPTTKELIGKKIDNLNLTISWFNRRLILAVRDQNVGEYRIQSVVAR